MGHHVESEKSMTFNERIRFAVTQMTGGCLVFAAWWAGFVDHIYNHDVTYITWIIPALLVVALWRGFMGAWDQAEQVGGWLVLLGLLGTVMGIGVAMSGVEGESYTLRDLGAATALNTTIMGIMGTLWVEVSRFISQGARAYSEKA